MRQYDANLVKIIQEKTYVQVVDGVPIEMKPVPDDDREHVVDPRVVETTRIKMNVPSLKRNTKFSLSGNRVRPDKVSYDITTTEVLESEDLVDINNDHMIDVYTFTPVDFEPNRPVLLYLHGGAYMTGDVAEFRMAMRFVAEQSGCKIIFPEYRLAPECPFPAGVDDCHAMVEWIWNHAEQLQVDRNKIMVGGDSAGSGLTNSCLVLDRDLHHIHHAFEYYGAYNANHSDAESVFTYDDFPVISEHAIYAKNRIDRIRFSTSTIGDVYMRGKVTVDDPIVSIIKSDSLAWLPSMTIVCGEYDFLRIGNDMFVKRALAEGVNIRSIRYLGCDHGFMEKVGVLPQAEEVLLIMAQTLKNL